MAADHSSSFCPELTIRVVGTEHIWMCFAEIDHFG
jgi:hypothetical protein